MKNDDMIKMRLSENIKRYRKENNLTQTQLAEKLNYSDKSISKWERNEGIPDVIILSKLAKLYNIRIDDFFSDKIVDTKPKKKTKKLLISLISFTGVWVLATILFTILSIFSITLFEAWLVFVYAIPASLITLVVFANIWGNIIDKFFSVSLLLWGMVIPIVVSFNNVKLWLLFVAAAPVQILIVLWVSLLKNKNNIIRKNT